MKSSTNLILSAWILIAVCLSTSVEAKQTGQEIIDNLKPVLDCQTTAMIHVRLDSLQLKKSALQITQLIDNIPADAKTKLESQANFFDQVREKLLKKGASDLTVVHRIGTLIDQNRMIIVRCRDADSALAVAKYLQLNHLGYYSSETRDNLVLLGWDELFDKLPRLADAELKRFAQSLDSVDQMPIRFALTFAADQKKALVAGDPKTWDDGSPSSIHNFDSIAAGVDLNGGKLNLKVRAADNKAAAAMADRTLNSAKRFANLKGVKRNLPTLSGWLSNLRLPVLSDSIELNMEGEEFKAMVRAFSQPILQGLKRQRYSEETVRVRQIAVGLLKYEAENGSFPPAYSVDEKGKPMHSWRVLILPHINQRNLYKEFRMSEPWDSPHNLEIAKLVPVHYTVDDGDIVDGMLHTRILAMVGDNSAIGLNRTKISQIVDGTVTTISIAAGSPEQAVPWTKPVDVTGTADSIASTMIESNPDGFWVATCDSGVHFVPPQANNEKLQWALQIDDGNLLARNGDNLAEALAGPDVAGPMYDPSENVPEWWTDYLIPVPWMASGRAAN